jgi:hypothetical protein
MNTAFLSKTISPSTSVTALESWIYGLLNATIIGGATSVSSWLGLVAAKSIGLDVPTLNLKAVGVIFISGAMVKFFAYLAQGLPSIQGQKQSTINEPKSYETTD